jgi:hypothetical protein
MNSEHINSRDYRSGWIRRYWVLFALMIGAAVLPNIATSSPLGSKVGRARQSATTSVDADFSSTVAAMANLEPTDSASIEKLEKKALGILDGIVLGALAGSGRADLDPLNARLANLVSHENGLGESYRAVRLGGKPVIFALVANFGLGAPSAIRFYAERGSPAHFALAGEIDRFTQKEMFDDSLEMLAVPLPEPVTDVVFVTVAGRTDKLQTGIFTAWRFDGKQLTQLWTTDLISHSTFQMSGENLILTYCHDPADQDSKTCPSMVREKYGYSVSDGKWRQVSSEPVPNPKN